MLKQCDCNFSMHFIPSIGNSAINILLCTSILACRIFLIAFWKFFYIPPLIFLDNLEVLHKFLFTRKILSPVIIQTWGIKSSARADPHQFWTWWSLIYTLFSTTFPFNVRIIWLDPFSDGSSFYVTCVHSHCYRKNQNRLTMSLRRPVFCVSNSFSSYRFSF